jgi:N utilization substance protein A
VLVPPDQLSLAIGREGQNVRLAARLTGWKIDIKNSTEYDQASEDNKVAELIAMREEDEALQAEAEARLMAEQALRAEEDARLRELYPLPEDEEEYAEGEAAYDEQAYAEAEANSEPAAETVDEEMSEEATTADAPAEDEAR